MVDPPAFGKRAKRATRETVLSRRDALSPSERAALSAVIAARTSALLAQRLAPGSVVALYAAKGSEVDTTEIDRAARAHGLRVVYPRVVDRDRRMAFHEVTLAELAVSRWDLREPTAEAPGVELDAIAAFVIPGLAFDRGGGRVGWGRGHYDTTLELVPSALRIGIAFECQLVESVPREPHDALLNVIITEAATHAVA